MSRAVARTSAVGVLLAALALAGCRLTADARPNPVADGGPGRDSGAADGAAADVGVPLSEIPGHEGVALDTTRKEGPRLMPAEAYVRSYLQLFGGLAPLEVQTEARPNGLFDTWNDYLQALGLPDYRVDLERNEQTSALMAATFERLGVALCDRAVLRDLRGARPVAERVVFAFELPAGDADAAAFATRFDVLHRTFLGYPAALAPAERVARFFQLYRETVTRPRATGATAFRPAEAGWAAVCYGLVRHPEFHLY